MNPSATGRPLSWLLIVVAAWTSGRIVIATAWPIGAPTAATAKRTLATRFVITGTKSALTRLDGQYRVPIIMIVPSSLENDGNRPSATPTFPSLSDTPIDIPALPPDTAPRNGSSAPFVPSVPVIQPQAAAQPRRWGLDSWLFWRDGGATVTLSGTGQLGGSQIGTRLHYDLTPSAFGRTSIYARTVSALQRPTAPEAAIGLSYQPSRQVPVSVALEKRIPLGRGGRNAFAIVAAGGFGPVDAGSGFRTEGYVQAGVVGLRSHDAFVDGKLSLYRPFIDSSLMAGMAISGGAQPHVNRLDVGPELQLRIPVSGSYTKLSAEWRERIAGRARPGSGVTVTLAAGF